MAGEERGINGSGHLALDKSLSLDTAPNRQQLIDMVRTAGLPSINTAPNGGGSVSEPSSPNKLLKRYTTKNTSSSSTLTSEEGQILEEEGDQIAAIPSVIINDTDGLEGTEEFRKRSGSKFYHESFTPAHNIHKPVTYIPSSKSAHQLTAASGLGDKKKRNIFSRIRRSFRRPKAVSDKKRWVDHEEELDPVSRPSYFRHIGHVVNTVGAVQTVELHKPPHGKFGIYIAQGIDPSLPQRKSIFVSRFYQENMSMFYGNLLRPGDEIIAVNGHVVRDYSVNEVSLMLANCQTVQLTVLPCTNGTTV